MSSFAEAFAGRSAMENICRYGESSGALDFRPQLRRIGGLIRRAIGTACLEAELVERCVVTDVRPGGSSVEILSCDESGPPCYRFVQGREQCPYADLYPSGLRIEVDRGAIAPADGTVVEISCPLSE